MRRGNNRSRGTIYFSLALCLLFSAKGISSDDLLSLPSLIEQALRTNPGVAASGSSAEAAKARAPQAGALPAPMLTVGVMSLPVDSFRLDREPMTNIAVGVSQEFPYPGKLARQGRAAGFEAESA